MRAARSPTAQAQQSTKNIANLADLRRGGQAAGMAAYMTRHADCECRVRTAQECIWVAGSRAAIQRPPKQQNQSGTRQTRASLGFTVSQHAATASVPGTR